MKISYSFHLQYLNRSNELLITIQKITFVQFGLSECCIFWSKLYGKFDQDINISSISIWTLVCVSGVSDDERSSNETEEKKKNTEAQGERIYIYIFSLELNLSNLFCSEFHSHRYRRHHILWNNFGTFIHFIRLSPEQKITYTLMCDVIYIDRPMVSRITINHNV